MIIYVFIMTLDDGACGELINTSLNLNAQLDIMPQAELFEDVESMNVD